MEVKVDTTRGVSTADAEAIIGLLATLEVRIHGGIVDGDTVDRIYDRMLRDGLISPAATGPRWLAVRQGLHDVNRRLCSYLSESDAAH